MKLPDRLEEIIKKDQVLYATVHDSIARFEPWINENRMVFFPEYTDHSIKHVEEVLQTAVDLMTHEAQDKITSHDAAVLTLGICFHDCAMHLSEDGFLTLIQPDSSWKPVNFFDSQPWHELWVDFLSEARRFDGRKLISLFGDATPIRNPPINKLDMTEKDKLLIGEFLRRHHARLAHEIALYGVPGVSGASYSLFGDKVSEEITGFSGLIARSHGVSLRRCVDYLRKIRAVREYQQIHAAYLMVLLRIADYLQIQAKRAKAEILEIRKLSSPFSQGEWKVHHCINNITLADEDPEAVYIDARPQDIHTFLRVKQWLDGIQQELDLSWAVLGEVYGRYEKEHLNKLALNLRRVRSSLDDNDEFSKEIDYVPEKVAFEAANSDLLKLLIGPLYGDDPGIGVRELIQNAVDSVHEFNDLSSQLPQLKNVDRNRINTDVLVEINCDDNFLPQNITITDRGVGMSLDIIKNYYLKAGASFRNSDAWKKEHEDDSGHSRVLRSGRFGVGALASFLIGNEIVLTTRHAEEKSEKGYCFKAKLDEDAISISRKQCCVGTIITINIPKSLQAHVRDNLLRTGFSRYDISEDNTFNLDVNETLGSYLLTSPNVEIIINPGRVKGVNDISIPNLDELWVAPWRSFDAEEYEKIFWTFDSVVLLACNGISVVSNKYRYLNYRKKRFGFKNEIPLYMNEPSVSVYDKDGRLPLNLQRTELINSDAGFGKELWRSIANDLMAYALVTAPDFKDDKKKIESWFLGKYKGFSHYQRDAFSYTSRWAIFNNGITLAEPFILKKVNCIALFNCYGNAVRQGDFYNKVFVNNLPSNMAMLSVGYFNPDSLNSLKRCIRTLFEHLTFYCNPVRREIPLVGRRVILSRAALDTVMNSDGLGKDLKRIIKSAIIEKELGHWNIYKVGVCPGESKLSLTDMFKSLSSEKQPIAFSEDYIKDHDHDNNDIVVKRWLEVFGDKLIPYEIKDRNILSDKDKEALQSYIDMNSEEFSVEVEEK